jgi:glyoxylase-like metal-dependent hydrolase (beta-lactamase superfamily II)
MMKRFSNTIKKSARLPLLGLVALFFTHMASADPDAGKDGWGQNRAITQISDSVYRFGSDGQYGAYIANEHGVVVVDGHYCASGTMAWLKDEIKKRHQQEVGYVILSHDHPDHICRTELFEDTATIIGHRNLRPHILREKREAAVPDVVFDEEMDLFLGDLKISLIYLGPTHSDNLIQVHVPSEKVLVAIDFARGKNLFPDYRDLDVHNALKALKTLSRLEDVELVLGGHGPVKTQDSFVVYHRYLQAQRDQVLDYMVEGKSLDEIKELVTMADFRDYPRVDEYLNSQIETMYDYLWRYREPNQPIVLFR